MGQKKTTQIAVENENRLKEIFMPRLRQAKREARLTQKEIAKKIGVTQAAMSRWMCGHGIPEPVFIGPLAEALNVSTDWLLGVETNRTEERVPYDERRMAKMSLAMDAIKAAIAYAESADED